MRYEELVPRVSDRIASTHTFYLKGRRICSKDSTKDMLVIKTALTVWSGMLLDLTSLIPTFELESPAMLGRYYVSV